MIFNNCLVLNYIFCLILLIQEGTTEFVLSCVPSVTHCHLYWLPMDYGQLHHPTQICALPWTASIC